MSTRRIERIVEQRLATLRLRQFLLRRRQLVGRLLGRRKLIEELGE